MVSLGVYYLQGKCGFPVDISKAIEMYHRASELGHSLAHENLATLYSSGYFIELNMEKAIYHWQVAAMKGNEEARFTLGEIVENNGNRERAMRHFIISAKSGHDMSLQKVKQGFIAGIVTKENFEIALRAHKDSQDAIKSDQRDRARADPQVGTV